MSYGKRKNCFTYFSQPQPIVSEHYFPSTCFNVPLNTYLTLYIEVSATKQRYIQGV